jgi:hypothetical protein
MSVKRCLDDVIAKKIFGGVIDIEISIDFYYALKILPYIVWES